MVGRRIEVDDQLVDGSRADEVGDESRSAARMLERLGNGSVVQARHFGWIVNNGPALGPRRVLWNERGSLAHPCPRYTLPCQ